MNDRGAQTKTARELLSALGGSPDTQSVTGPDSAKIAKHLNGRGERIELGAINLLPIDGDFDDGVAELGGQI